MAVIDRRGATVDATDPAVQADPNPGIAIKAPVLVATTANITLSGLQTIDGVVLVANNRVLVKNQTTASQNGIYVASSGNWTRAFDLQGNSQIAHGTTVFVTTGTTQNNTQWVMTSNDPITVGTTSMNWAQQQLSISAFGAIQSAIAATFLTVSSQSALLSNSRSFTAAAPLTISDGGAGGVLTVGLSTPLSQANGGTGTTSFSNLNNVRLAKTTSYSVSSNDIGSTIALGGSAYYTLTVNAASGYASNFQARVLNEDTGRGKLMSINGLSNFILWPGQSFTLFAQNNTWRINPAFQRYASSAGVTVFVNSISGSDSNDGLVPNSGAFATLAGAYGAVRDQMDHTGGTPTIKADANQTIAVGAGFFANYSLVGARALQIQGDTGVIFNCNAGSVVFQARDGAATIILASTGSSFGVIRTSGNASAGITASQAGVCDTPPSGLTFYGFPLGTHVQLVNGGTTDFQGGYTIADPFASTTATHINLEGAGCHCNYQISSGATFSGNPTITTFLIQTDCSVFYTAGVNPTFTGSPLAGCQKYNLANNAVANTNGTTLPGSVAGVTARGAIFA